MHTLGFNSRFRLPHLTWSLPSAQVWGGFQTLSFKVFYCFSLGLLAFDTCFGHQRFCWCHQHWLVGACTGNGLAPEHGADGQPKAASLHGQRCCQWILISLGMYTVCNCSISNAEFCRQLALQQGIWLVPWSSMPGWSLVSGQSIIITITVNVKICNKRACNYLITYLYIIIMSLLHFNMPLLPVITVILDNYNCHYSNNGPIITVTMDLLLLPIITRSNNGSSPTIDLPNLQITWIHVAPQLQQTITDLAACWQ